MRTACLACAGHRCTHDGSTAGPSSDSWFYQRCRLKLLNAEFNPLTGEMESPKEAYCRDVNKGDCKLWIER